MNLKLNAAILVVGIIAGALIMRKFSPSSVSALPPAISTEKKNEQRVVTRVITRLADGSERIEEKEQIKSASSNEQKPSDKKHSIGLIPKYNLDSRDASLGLLYTYKNIGAYVAGTFGSGGPRLQEVGLALTYSF